MYLKILYIASKTNQIETIMKRISCILLVLLVSLTVFSQKEQDFDIFDISLEDLLNLEVTVASRQAISQREAPGILSVITADEIEKSGARDMIDVLRLVPGFNFNIDVEGTFGVSIRGNWAHEGKVLVMLDGQEMNESLYSTSVFGGRFPVAQIQRVEIIRGPGSSIYGGYAELGVINIITKKGEQINKVEVSSYVGVMGDDIGTSFINFNIGKKVNDIEFSLLGNYGISRHSYNELFEDFYGGTSLISGTNAQNEALWINAGLKFKNLSWRFIHDGYNVTASSLFDDATPEPFNLYFGGVYSELNYKWSLNEKFTVTPQYNLKVHNPWRCKDEYGDQQDVLISKHKVGVNFSADFTKNINLIAGTEFYSETAQDRMKLEMLLDGKEKITFNNLSLYTQVFYKQTYFNLIAGGRFDYHEVFGGAFAPRLGFTKAFNKFHYKALYSHAFRSPGIMNISLEPEIEPETTIVYELEAGYQLTTSTIFTVNLFDITINKPIVYFYDEETEAEGYLNGEKTGTMGSEVNFRWQKGQNNFNLGYSIYFAAGKNKVENYEVKLNKDAMVGIPQHKFTLNSSWRLLKNGLFFNPQIIAMGKRYAYTEVNDDGEPVLKEVNPSLLISLNLLYRNAFIKGLDLSIGVFDLLNAKPPYYQAYNGYHPPYPGKHREIFFKLSYNLSR